MKQKELEEMEKGIMNEYTATTGEAGNRGIDIEVDAGNVGAVSTAVTAGAPTVSANVKDSSQLLNSASIPFVNLCDAILEEFELDNITLSKVDDFSHLLDLCNKRRDLYKEEALKYFKAVQNKKVLMKKDFQFSICKILSSSSDTKYMLNLNKKLKDLKEVRNALCPVNFDVTAEELEYTPLLNLKTVTKLLFKMFEIVEDALHLEIATIIKNFQKKHSDRIITSSGGSGGDSNHDDEKDWILKNDTEEATAGTPRLESSQNPDTQSPMEVDSFNLEHLLLGTGNTQSPMEVDSTGSSPSPSSSPSPASSSPNTPRGLDTPRSSTGSSVSGSPSSNGSGSGGSGGSGGGGSSSSNPNSNHSSSPDLSEESFVTEVSERIQSETRFNQRGMLDEGKFLILKMFFQIDEDTEIIIDGEKLKDVDKEPSGIISCYVTY